MTARGRPPPLSQAIAIAAGAYLPIKFCLLSLQWRSGILMKPTRRIPPEAEVPIVRLATAGPKRSFVLGKVRAGCDLCPARSFLGRAPAIRRGPGATQPRLGRGMAAMYGASLFASASMSIGAAPLEAAL